jgi:uncharacterized protein with NRDE domain
MCLILLAHDVHPRYRLVVAANRDEFYERPTAPTSWWEDEPAVLGGRDLRSGGTWMGVTRNGRFAAITNLRELGKVRADAPSRGGLVLDGLTTDLAPDRYLEGVRSAAGAYNGFNLLVGDGQGLWVYSNRGGVPPREVGRGVFGLSNHLLDTSWPKVEGGKKELEQALELAGEELADRLLELLGDRSVPPDDALPDTGVGLEFERALAPRFIVSPVYGTRASYAVLFDRSGEVVFVEQVFEDGRAVGEPTRFSFRIEAS